MSKHEKARRYKEKEELKKSEELKSNKKSLKEKTGEKLSKKEEKKIKKAEKREAKKEKKALKKKGVRGVIRGFFKWIFISLFLIILVFTTDFLYRAYRNGWGLSGFLAAAVGHDEYTLKNLKPLRVLVLGISDANQGSDEPPYYLSDTIMIMEYDPKTQRASLMSISRDTYVGRQSPESASMNYLQSYKINSVFRNMTNIDEAVERISDITGIEIENYIILDTKALVKFVDLIGGVDYNVPIDMKYTDEGQNLYIDLKAGMQKIDGKKAEQLLRFRHNDDNTSYDSEYGDNDIGRMRTQREFIVEMVKQAAIPGNIFKLQSVLDIIKEDVTSNVDFNLLKDYIPYAVKFESENLRTAMLPVSTGTYNNVSIATVSKYQATEIIKVLFPEEKIEELPEGEEGQILEEEPEIIEEEFNPAEITISITNSSGVEENLEKISTKLKEKGFNVVKERSSKSTTTTTTITNRTNKPNNASRLIKDIIGRGSITIGYDNMGADYTIIIGEDYN